MAELCAAPSPRRASGPLIACRLVDFFRYYARDFPYNTSVASIRAGPLKKESKGWQGEVRHHFHVMSPKMLIFGFSATDADC